MFNATGKDVVITSEQKTILSIHVAPEIVRQVLRQKLAESIHIGKAEPSKGQREWIYSVAR